MNTSRDALLLVETDSKGPNFGTLTIDNLKSFYSATSDQKFRQKIVDFLPTQQDISIAAHFLHCAAGYGHGDVVEAAIKENAQSNSKISSDDTAIVTAWKHEKLQVVGFLYHHGVNLEALLLLRFGEGIVKAHEKESFLLFLSLLKPGQIDTTSGDNAMHVAASSGFADCVSLLTSDADFREGVLEKNFAGKCPYHVALPEVVDSLRSALGGLLCEYADQSDAVNLCERVLLAGANAGWKACRPATLSVCKRDDLPALLLLWKYGADLLVLHVDDFGRPYPLLSSGGETIKQYLETNILAERNGLSAAFYPVDKDVRAAVPPLSLGLHSGLASDGEQEDEILGHAVYEDFYPPVDEWSDLGSVISINSFSELSDSFCKWNVII